MRLGPVYAAWPLVPLLVVLGGCTRLKPEMDYRLDRRSPPIPLRVGLRVTGGARLQQRGELLEGFAQAHLNESFKRAFRRDLTTNGPVSVVVVNPDAWLTISYAVEADGPDLWWMSLASLFIGAPFGLPHTVTQFRYEARYELQLPDGSTLLRGTHATSCRSYTGLYYNHDVTAACVAESLGQWIRNDLVRGKADITHRMAEAAKRLAHAPGPPPVVAVLDVRDQGNRLREGMAGQLSEYIATKLAQQGTYKVVPRTQVRSALEEMKAESFSDCFEESCQVELGRALAANKTVSTSLVGAGNDCALTIAVFDLRTEATERAATAEISCAEEALLEGVRELIYRLNAPPHSPSSVSGESRGSLQ